MKFSKYIAGGLLMAGMLLASCSDDFSGTHESEITTPAEDDGMVNLTLNLKVDGLDNKVTRADGTEQTLTLRELQNIDMMVYALRDSLDNLLNQYGKGIDDALKGKPALENYKEDDDNNQTIMAVSWNDNGDNTYSLNGKITLRVMRGTVFKLTVWAQNSSCKAYDFNNFNAIKVDYDGAKNNNVDNRDAFCAMTKFSIGQVDSEISITLTRPFAQINVGVQENAPDNNKYNETYTDSKIELSGVSKYFNLVKNKVWTQDEIDDYLDELEENKKEDPTPISSDPYATTDALFDYAPRQEEPFEVTNYASGTWNRITYKNLSSCFVLVPEAVYHIEDGELNDPNGSNVQIQLKAFSLRGEIKSSDDEPSIIDEVSYQGESDKLISLGVKRNWRTNLLFSDWNWIDAQKRNN